MKWFISIYIFVLALISSVASFNWQDCGPSTNPVKLQELSVTRTGDIFYISMKSKVAANLTEPIEAKLRIKKKMPFIDVYVEIPCIDNLGSCDYKDICEFSPWTHKPCPAVFVKNHLPCRCPILQNVYSGKQLPLDLSPFADAIQGTYKLQLLLYKGKEELFCFSMKIKI